MNSVQIIRERLSRAGFGFPSLTLNMRNPVNIQTSYEKIYGYGETEERKNDSKRKEYDIYKGATSKGTLIPSTVRGKVTIVIPTLKAKLTTVELLGSVLLKYFDKEEPVVVLIGQKSQKVDVISKAADCIREHDHFQNVVTYKFIGEHYNPDQDKCLERFLCEPTGVFVTDAEAFHGMQARNIVLVGSTSSNVRKMS